MNFSKRSLVVLSIVACTTLPAAAQFGNLLGAVKSGPGADPGAANVDQALKVFSDKSTGIESTLSTAAAAIGSAYGSEEERAKLAAQRESLAKATDPKEKSARQAEMAQTGQSILEREARSTELDQKTKAMSDAKKQFLAKAVALYLSGALQAKDLMPSGQNLLASASSNPMNLGKLLNVRESLPRLGNAVAFAGGSIPKLVRALQGANVKVVEPKSSSEKMADVSDADFAAS